jgi:hypothetical protein
MAKINVKFGYPISEEEQELLSEKAIERARISSLI